MDSGTHAQTLARLAKLHESIHDTTRQTAADALAEFAHAMTLTPAQVAPPVPYTAPIEGSA